MNNKTNGFTLVELVMVIAILAIISTFAVGKFSNIQKQAARQVSVANMQNIGRLVESYITVNKGKLNRLDSLVNYNAAGLTQDGFGNFVQTGLYNGPDSAVPAVLDKNAGLNDGLKNILCVYKLSAAESKALYDDIGLKYVMRHWRDVSASPHDRGVDGDDGSVVTDISVAKDAELSACIATTNEQGLVCAAITGMNAEGRAVYRDFGQDLLATASSLSASYVRDEISATGGPLLAFGLGDGASIVGATQGGIDAAPYSDAVQSKYYRQYILLVRLRQSGSSVSAEFAGVIDPEGNTIRTARQLLK